MAHPRRYDGACRFKARFIRLHGGMVRLPTAPMKSEAGKLLRKLSESTLSEVTILGGVKAGRLFLHGEVLEKVPPKKQARQG